MLVVSVHDVAPSAEAEVAWLLDRLDAAGVAARVLKVVPHEDGVGDLRRHPGLVDLLHREVANGSELVLHGFTHRADGPPVGPWIDVARARLFAAGRAELLSIGDAEVARRLRDGLAILDDVGLSPSGYCAPAWLARPVLRDMLDAAGLRYAVWLSGLQDVATGRRLVVPPAGFMGAGGIQEALVQIGGLISATAARLGAPLRIVLHPQGARGSPHAARAITLASVLTARRRLLTYTELLDA